MAFIAGQYTVKYNDIDVGQVQEGITIEHTVFKQVISGDDFAETPQDAVFRGMAVFAQFTTMEFAENLRAFHPYGTTYLTMNKVIGTLDTSNATALKLTAIAGTPASLSPVAITASIAILAEGYPVGILFAPALRTVPIRMRFYPNVSGVFASLA